MDDSRLTEPLPPSERLLLKEITHRVNNEFAAAIGVVSAGIACASSEESRGPLVRIRNSLENFAHVHHLLGVPDLRTRIDGCAYLRALCGAISASRLQSTEIQVLVVERSLAIDSEQCWRLGLIVSELVTNAVRHAFASGQGRVTVEAHREDSSIHCSVRDNGGGAEFSSHGTGLRIVDALLRDLHGRMEQQFGNEGVAVRIVFPTAMGQT